jgi:anti-sigma factor RsiW
MECDTCQAALEARLDGELTADEAREIDRHLAICPACARQFATLGVAIAIVSSGITLVAANRSAGRSSAADELLASHVRSLMPGHLTDVLSTQQHTVKPWFNGRVDLSPAVPNLDKAGFPLIGGRADYVRGRVVPVVVYGRRQHMINVYAWPSSSAGGSPPDDLSRNGYHFVTWRSGGIEYWAVSDLNAAELHTFVAMFVAAH